jgi:hypothetical protein
MPRLAVNDLVHRVRSDNLAIQVNWISSQIRRITDIVDVLTLKNKKRCGPRMGMLEAIIGSTWFESMQADAVIVNLGECPVCMGFATVDNKAIPVGWVDKPFVDSWDHST